MGISTIPFSAEGLSSALARIAIECKSDQNTLKKRQRDTRRPTLPGGYSRIFGATAVDPSRAEGFGSAFDMKISKNVCVNKLVTIISTDF